MPPFNNVYFLGAKPNQLTSVIRTPDGDGYVATGNFAGATLLQLSSTGVLGWARRYSSTLPLQAVMVRRAGSGEFFWVGQTGTPEALIPFVVKTDPAGTVIAAVQINLPHGIVVSAESKAIEITGDGRGLVVGGIAWRGANDSAPWIARFDLDLTLLWVRMLSLPQSSRIESLFPTLDDGVIGVGRVLPHSQARPRAYAFKLESLGSPVWANRYDVSSFDAHPEDSDQWLADIDRDTRRLESRAFVVGTVTQLCTPLVPSLPCDPTPAAALVATLDEVTGSLSPAFGVWSGWKDSAIDGVTLVDESVREETVFGGSLSNGTPGNEEGLLVRLRSGAGSVLSATAYGDEAGPFDSRIVDLRRSRYDESPVFDFGFAFVTRQHRDDTLERPNLVRTDELGSALSYPCCERKSPVNARPITLDPTPLTPEPFSGTASPFPLLAEDLPLQQKPCSQAGQD